MPLEDPVKAILLTTGDHHTGPDYDHCVLMPVSTDLDGLLSDFRSKFPTMCAQHSYNDDRDHTCEECAEEAGITEVALDALGYKEVGARGFWNGAFAEWLVRVKGAEAVPLEEVAVR
jgi:hypothetical protein